MSRLSAGNPCLELLAREPLAVERERDEPLQLEDRSLSVSFLRGGGGPVLIEREIGLVRNGSASTTTALGERGGRNAPSPPLSWDWRPGGRKGLLPWAHRSNVLQRVKLWSLGTVFHRLLT